MRHFLLLILSLLFVACKLNNSVELNEDVVIDTPEEFEIFLETSADGSGSKYSNLDIDINHADLSFYAVKRNPQGTFLENTAVTWSLSGSLGSLSEASDKKSAVLSGLTAGSGQLLITLGEKSHSINLDIATAPAQITFASSSQTVLEPQDPWQSGMSSWSKRKKLYLLNGHQNETLTNFPVLVLLNSSKINYSDFKADGGDLRFFDSSGNSLKYEIEGWNASGDSIVWVKVPSIPANSNSEYIWMYYSNSSAGTIADPNNVWSNNYGFVLHLGTTPTANLSDSTANNYSASSSGSMTSGDVVSGKMGKALDFDGLNDGLSIPYYAGINTNEFTLSGWVKNDSSQLGTKRTIFYNISGGNGYRLDITSGNIWEPIGYNGGNPIALERDVTAKSNEWEYVALSCNLELCRYYSNGVFREVSMARPYVKPSSGNLNMAFGASVDYFKGQIDEVRHSPVVRSKAWLRAQYLSQADQFVAFTEPSANTSRKTTIQVSQQIPSSVTVNYTVSGTASGADHSLSSGSFIIPANQTTYDLNFDVYADSFSDAGETIILTLTSASAGKIPTNEKTTLTIQENQGPSAGTKGPVFVNQGSGLAIYNVINLSPADSHPGGQSFNLVAAFSQRNGIVNISGGQLQYTPDAREYGVDKVIYQLEDSNGGVSFGSLQVNIMTPYTWVGLGGSDNWTDTSNWCGTVSAGSCTGTAAPNGSKQVVFDGTCVNCNSTINDAFSPLGITLFDDFLGTLSQAIGTGNIINMGKNGMKFYGGSFVGGDANISLAGYQVSSFIVDDGVSFTSTSATLTVRYGAHFAKNSFFSHNMGTFRTFGDCGCSYQTTLVQAPNNPFWNLNIQREHDSMRFLNGPIYVDNELYLNGHVSKNIPLTGDFYVKGNVLSDDYGYSGTALIRLVGDGAQTVDLQGLYTPTGNWVINKPTGSVTFLDDVILSGASQSANVIVGDVYMGGYNFTVGSSLYIGPGQTVHRGGGTLTVNSSPISDGSYSSGTVAP